MVPEHSTDPLAVALAFSRVLEKLGVQYLVGGSLASSVHGEPRSTLDVDMVVDLHPTQVDALVHALGDSYYVDADVAREATAAGASFNAIHVASSVKVDLFVAGRDAFEADRLASALEVSLGPERTDRLRVDAPTHLILRKLEWYRRGGEVSERQWRDVQAVVTAQGDRLDRAVLQRWAPVLGITDLVDRLLPEA
jgi:hypothetical protein